MSLSTDNPEFKLGVFSANLSSGLAVTTIPERWEATWENNLRMAELADAADIDFILPVARYRGYGGVTDFEGSGMDPITLTAAMLARTKRITVFSTVHTAFTHPLLAARQLGTCDQIGPGRAGLNIVAGWNRPEYDMFGIDLPEAHPDRYAYAQEWIDVVRLLWTSEDPVTYKGEYFRIKDALVKPRPADPLPLLNAGSSDEGRAYGARNVDYVFTLVGNAEQGEPIAAGIRQAAVQQFGRDVGVMTTSHIVCRPTETEALDFVHYYAEEHADWDAVDNLMAGLGMTAKTFTPEQLRTFRPRFASGHGSVPIFGNPDQVADQIAAFARAGFAGITI